jgi:hypothetical protein
LVSGLTDEDKKDMTPEDIIRYNEYTNKEFTIYKRKINKYFNYLN